ncbi:hypothetical protein J416_08112 [Gracilibacillus halophilus YIM-C55.5]|uniref:DUF2953 domain-containing protein n=1 Tax=Gracilibacillus halophilus YIM-C55.5 TaxID=1308866 RepID=N4WCG4_9BACI|nr:hypothetical protein [Gracilibacillus halophilus]ENH96934.1 hypothetical protein J416_08112 [Gracilibacillus halophilus YIM-C55.5]
MLLLAIVLILIVILCVALPLIRIYVRLEWEITDEKRVIYIKVYMLGLRVWRNTYDMDQFLDDNHPSSSLTIKQRLQLFQYIKQIGIERVRFEQFEAEAVIGTGEPDTTSIIYGILQSLFEVIKHQFLSKVFEEHKQPLLLLAADFEHEVYQSEGICMISLKLSNTMIVIKKWKRQKRMMLKEMKGAMKHDEK